MRLKARTDFNHAVIVSALRFMGCSVQSLAQIGKGCPDLLVAYRGVNLLIEIKTITGKLNKEQVKWHQFWKGPVVIARTPEEAISHVQTVVKLLQEGIA